MASKNAFTMIEIIVAAFVVCVGVAGAAAVFPYGMKLVKTAAISNQAGQLCKERIEELDSYSYDSILPGYSSENPLPPPFSQFLRETRVSYIDPSSGLSEVSDDLGIKKIEVSVSWKSFFSAGNKNITITTLVSEK